VESWSTSTRSSSFRPLTFTSERLGDSEWDEDRGILSHESALSAKLDQFAGDIPKAKLLAAFRKEFRREVWIRPAIREVCLELDRAFDDTLTDQLPREEILTQACGVLEYVNDPARKNIVNALVESFVWLTLMEEVRLGVYSRRWQLSASYVTNCLFGVLPQISGFDELLDGGLLPTTSEGLAILIHGKPGTGKTMLALQLAASMAAQGYAAVYLTAEESPESLREKLSYAGYFQRSRSDATFRLSRGGSETEFTLITSNFIDAQLRFKLTSAWKQYRKGTLVLARIPNRESFPDSPNSRLMMNLRHTFKHLREKDIRSCYVLDSMDSVLERGGRRLYEETFNFARSRVGIGIFVSEEHEAEDQQLRHYLVDMRIRMGYRKRKEAFSERVLEIEKCKTQSHIRGEHMFGIHGGSGITVYPSVQSRLSILRRRTRKGLSSKAESWKLDANFNLDPILREDIATGDSILLYGPPATHKFPVGLSFLVSGLSEYPSDYVLLISLREDEPSILRIIERYPQFKNLLQRHNGTMRPNPRFKILHVPPDYFSAERFIHWVRETFREQKKAGGAVRRVLFSTLSQLQYNSPMFGEEPLFIASLIELFKKEAVTSLFLGVGDNRNAEVGNIFDTILATTKQDNAGQEEIFLSVSHSGPCNALRSPNRLERTTRDGLGWLELRPVPESPKR